MATSRTAYFFDFDHTLFDTDVFFHVHVRTAFLQFGISKNVWELCYEEVLQSGYTLERHVREMNFRTENSVPLGAMQRVLREQFSDLRRYVYPDVAPFLEKLAAGGARLNLLSFGSPEWQRYKVRASGLERYFSEMFFTDVPQQKWQVVAAARRFGQMTVVDNNPPELDAIKDHVPEAWTFCINRVPAAMVATEEELARLAFLEARRYLSLPHRHPHFKIRTLDDLLV